jgi:MFS family permease
MSVTGVSPKPSIGGANGDGAGSRPDQPTKHSAPAHRPTSYIPAPAAAEIHSTLRILATTILNFACYFTIGMQLAVVPGFVHMNLGYGAVLAGLAVSAQYAATLSSRPFVGRMSDTKGPKWATETGLCAIAGSGLLFILAALLHRNALASLSVLLLSRFVLGFGESWVATGSALWGIARMGDGWEAKVISWSGIGSYGALAAGAPFGIWLEHRFDLGAVGIMTVGVALAALVWAVTLGAVPVVAAKRLHPKVVLQKVFADGVGLALGGIGFGTIAAFISLYYATRGWAGASLSLTLFGVAFVIARLLFVDTILRWGGYRVAIVSLAIECAGFVVLWLAPTPLIAKIGATVAGFGFALVFPALGVEAVGKVATENRGSALAIFTAFIDLSLGISGPVAGVVAGVAGFHFIFLFAALAAASGIALAAKLSASAAREAALESA